MFWVVLSFGQNSRSATFKKKGGFSSVPDKLETHLVHNELWHLVLAWFLQSGYLYVECIHERQWPLIKQKMAEAAQRASSAGSLGWESGHAGSATAENGSGGQRRCAVWAVLPRPLRAGGHSAALPEPRPAPRQADLAEECRWNGQEGSGRITKTALC